MKRRPLVAAAALAAMAWCSPASAHGTIKTLGSFYSGVLHPFLVPAHVLAIAATGLLIGQLQRDGLRTRFLAFVAAYAAGLAATLFGTAWPGAPTAALLVAATAGTLVAAGLALPSAWVAVLVASSGVILGLDSAAEETSLVANLLMTFGTFLGGVFAVVAAAVFAESASQKWHQIGVRVVGSWTAAASILVLALAFSRFRHSG